MSKQRKSASKTPAKGKADNLITNAESPAAECSRPMPPHGKGRTGIAQVAGTQGRARQWAAEQADKIKTEAEGAEFPVLYLAAAYTEQAFHLAVRAAQWTRGGEPPIVADFVNLFAALHEYRNRARDFLEGQDTGGVWEHWTATPGTVYCWKSNNSALAVAYDFARMIESEIFCNCPVSYNVPATPCNAPAFSQWRDEAIAGIGKRSLPPLSDWPRWMIHRDTQALLCKLSAEYGQAAKAAAAEKPQAAAAQADKPGLDGDTHGPDFRSVRWGGETYEFTANQSACVERLWKAMENGTPDVGGATLLTLADINSKRIQDVFRDNPAWNVLIVPGATKGAYRIAPKNN
jgi:HEPN domain-containing protein